MLNGAFGAWGGGTCVEILVQCVGIFGEVFQGVGFL